MDELTNTLRTKKYFMRKLYSVITAILLFACLQVDAQEDESKKLSPKKEERKNRPYFLGIGFGLNGSSFRDFATSPLIYSGTVYTFSMSATRVDAKKETLAELRFSTGNYTAAIAESFSSSSVFSIFNSYQQLFRLNKYSNDKWNLKVGGNIGWSLNSRSNPSLGNNSSGLEIIGTLFGSAKVTRDLSRKKEKNVKILFVKYKLKPLRRDLSVQFNTGLVNANFRNGFAFIAQDALLNESDTFADYQFNLFSGFRLSSRIDYTLYLTKGNLLRFSYLWDAYRTGNEFDKFEMGNHMLTASLWFRTK